MTAVLIVEPDQQALIKYIYRVTIDPSGCFSVPILAALKTGLFLCGVFDILPSLKGRKDINRLAKRYTDSLRPVGGK